MKSKTILGGRLLTAAALAMFLAVMIGCDSDPAPAPRADTGRPPGPPMPPSAKSGQPQGGQDAGASSGAPSPGAASSGQGNRASGAPNPGAASSGQGNRASGAPNPGAASSGQGNRASGAPNPGAASSGQGKQGGGAPVGGSGYGPAIGGPPGNPGASSSGPGGGGGGQTGDASLMAPDSGTGGGGGQTGDASLVAPDAGTGGGGGQTGDATLMAPGSEGGSQAPAGPGKRQAAQPQQPLAFRLSNGVAKAQNDGTAVNFSVQYNYESGQAARGAKYVWIIEPSKGDPIERPARLRTKSTLRFFAKDVKPSQGPFQCYLAFVQKDGTKKPISSKAAMK